MAGNHEQCRKVKELGPCLGVVVVKGKDVPGVCVVAWVVGVEVHLLFPVLTFWIVIPLHWASSPCCHPIRATYKVYGSLRVLVQQGSGAPAPAESGAREQSYSHLEVRGVRDPLPRMTTQPHHQPEVRSPGKSWMVIMCLRRDRINSPHRGRASVFQAWICLFRSFGGGSPRATRILSRWGIEWNTGRSRRRVILSNLGVQSSSIPWE